MPVQGIEPDTKHYCLLGTNSQKLHVLDDLMQGDPEMILSDIRLFVVAQKGCEYYADE